MVIYGLMLGMKGSGASVIFGLLLIPLFISSVSLGIRRLHDLDKSGWMILIYAVPLLNAVFGIYLLAAKGTDGPNRFGADPLDSHLQQH